MLARAVKRGRQRTGPTVVRRIGVDEQAAAKGHRSVTLGCDVEDGTVEHIAEERKQERRDGYSQGLSEEQLAGIKAVALDRWEPYIAMSEGLNSTIQKIKSMDCGFRNIENFKTAIYVHCDGLNLYPC